MNQKPLPSFITVVDIGTHKTSALIAQVIDGRARMLGFSERRTDGVIKGTVVDLEKLHASVHEVVNDLERVSQRPVHDVYFSIAGPAVQGERVRGLFGVPAHDGRVTKIDYAAAIESAKRLEPPQGRVTMLYMRQPTLLDGKPVTNPVGQQGRRLEVNFWRITMEEANVRFRVAMANGMSINVRDFILSAHASACAVTNSTEKQGGVCVIDIGAGTTDWVLYFKGHILCSGSIPVGGEHITNDLSVALRISRDTAEDLKLRFASALHRDHDVQQTIWKDGDKSVGDQQFNRGTITQVSSIRFQEILTYVKKDILAQLDQIFTGHEIKIDANFLPSGIILTGGSANLADAAEAGQNIFGVSTRIGIPKFDNSALQKSEYAGVVGMMIAAIEDAPLVVRRQKGFIDILRDLFRF